MGKTARTYRERVDTFIDQFDQFRRALRYEYQDGFDETVEHIHRHSMAGSAAGHSDLETRILFSIAVGQQAQIQELAQRIEALESDGTTEQRDGT
jgi:hypothetical protein